MPLGTYNSFGPSVVDQGFTKKSTYGYAWSSSSSVFTGVSSSILNVRLDNRATNNTGRNFVPYSNNLMDSSWINVGDVSRSVSSSVEFFDGTTQATRLVCNATTGAGSGLLAGVRQVLPYTFNPATVYTMSCWVASEGGTAGIKIGFGSNTASTRAYRNFDNITNVPQRISFTTVAGDTWTAGQTVYVTNGTADGGATNGTSTLLIWGLQIEANDTATEIEAIEPTASYLTSGLWTKDTRSENHYNECDLVTLGSGTDGVVDYVPLTVKSINSKKYIGVRLTGADYKTVQIFSPTGWSYTYGSLDTYPCRLRAEIRGNKFTLKTGPVGVSNPSTILIDELEIPSSVYSGFSTSTETGFGFYPITNPASEVVFSNISDNYESGALLSAPTVAVITPDAATSSTRATKIAPDTDRVKTAWMDWFENGNQISLVDIGFEKGSGTGYATTVAGTGVDDLGGSSILWSTTNTTNIVSNSTNMFGSTVWVGINGGTKTSNSAIVTMPDGTMTGTVFNLTTTVQSGFRYSSSITATANSYYTVSCWVATQSGTATVRLARGSNANFLSSDTNTFFGADEVVNTTPRRISFQVPVQTTNVSVYYGLTTGSSNAAATIVAWGFQAEGYTDGYKLTEFRARYTSYDSATPSALWMKDTGVTDHYIEADVLSAPGSTTSGAFLMPLVLRAVNGSKFVSIVVDSTNTAYVYSPQGIALGTASIGTIPISPPYRLRAEIYGGAILVYYGSLVGVRGGALNYLGSYGVSPSIYTEFTTATKTGLGFTPVSSTTRTFSDILDSYDSGENQGAKVAPNRARSITTAGQPLVSWKPADNVHSDVVWFNEMTGTNLSLVDIGFEKLSSTGYGYVNGGSTSFTWYNYKNTISNVGAPINRIDQSNNLMHSNWTTFGNATKLGFHPTVTFFDGTKNGTIISLDPGADAGIKQRLWYNDLTPGATYTISCWVSAPGGSASVRLSARNTASNAINAISSNFTIGQTPQRVSFSFVATASNHNFCLSNGSAFTFAQIVAWGFQVNNGSTLRELVATGSSDTSYMSLGVWAIDAESPNQYIDCDIRTWPGNAGFTPYVHPLAMRVIDSTKFIYVYTPYAGLGVTTQPVYVNSSTGQSYFVGTLPTKDPIKLRAEVYNNEVYIYYGTVGVRDPNKLLGKIVLPENLYDGFMTATKTGLACNKQAPNSNDSRLNVSDNYESGKMPGPPRSILTPNKALSSTRVGKMPPANVIWYERFSDDVGTPLVDLGFTYESEVVGGFDPEAALISPSHNLTLESTINASESWTKGLENYQNQFIQANILYRPYELTYLLVLRATDEQNFFGISFDEVTNEMIVGYKINNVVYELDRISGITFPTALRLEAMGNKFKVFTGAPTDESGATDFTFVGEENGYLINAQDLPQLMSGKKSGIARAKSTANEEIADNYFSGHLMVPGSYPELLPAISATYAPFAPFSEINRPTPLAAVSGSTIGQNSIVVYEPSTIDDVKLAKSSTRSGSFFLETINAPTPRRARSSTSIGEFDIDLSYAIFPETDLDGNYIIQTSSTYAGEIDATVNYEMTVDKAISSTFADVVDIDVRYTIDIQPARSVTYDGAKTRVYLEPAVSSARIRPFTMTASKPVSLRPAVSAARIRTMSLHMINNPTPLKALSATYVRHQPVNGNPGTIISPAKSATIAGQMTIMNTYSINLLKAFSQTYGDANTIEEFDPNAQWPWIFN